MNTINLGNYHLDFKPNYIKIKINEGSHFDSKAFEECYFIKQEIYGNLKIGILVTNDSGATYSIDPMFLVNYRKAMEAHLQWVIVVSNYQPDYRNFEYLKRLTDIPCKFVNNYKSLEELPGFHQEDSLNS
ncbi:MULTISPECIES: hypothetical protein [unclassified Leeuwenhoekiella]|uniref:hypothetical protein n=1 Tax=unclassified Leeuwenhoekiella TaxID=2615029 RepID=UPI000C69DFF9|nr:MULTISPECIES: hypothetical protein [unclassified Leeuwenhoekiella]MAW97039.1 hypothetical protein [Leeuwenhoekiella sp.]MBA80680.1 hypothetical protein [Leeuwenhoekiella sp.]|tara:strand:+ start:54608 stop:54997 length:390 start_codon:yes stop_codon:yes gene_type:complete